MKRRPYVKGLQRKFVLAAAVAGFRKKMQPIETISKMLNVLVSPIYMRIGEISLGMK